MKEETLSDVFGWGFGVKRSLHADNVLSCNNGYSLFKVQTQHGMDR